MSRVTLHSRLPPKRTLRALPHFGWSVGNHDERLVDSSGEESKKFLTIQAYNSDNVNGSGECGNACLRCLSYLVETLSPSADLGPRLLATFPSEVRGTPTVTYF